MVGLVHSDEFMVKDLQHVKEWLHTVRSRAETLSSVSDPFASLEADGDGDITAFPRIEGEGPP